MFEENDSFRQPRYAMARKLFCHKSNCHGLEAAEVEVSRLHCDSVLGQSELELEGDLVTHDVRHGGLGLAAIFPRIYGFQFNFLHLAAGGPTCPEIDRHTSHQNMELYSQNTCKRRVQPSIIREIGTILQSQFKMSAQHTM